MMDFRDWLRSYVDSGEPGQIKNLYDAIQGGEPYNDGLWEITREGNQMFVRTGDGDRLRLASQYATTTFLSIMDEMYSCGMGIEAWSDCENAIANDKS